MAGTHGGKRPGAGRKPGGRFGEKTVRMRIPESRSSTITLLLGALQHKAQQPNADLDISDLKYAVLDPIPQPLPVGMFRVSAGFPSPAADHDDGERLDINEYLVKNPIATFFFSVVGDSMQGVGIEDGDMLVVDRSISPQAGHIVIAFLNGERLVKTLQRIPRLSGWALVAANPAYPDLEIGQEDDFQIWGVVTGSFKRFLGKPRQS